MSVKDAVAAAAPRHHDLFPARRVYQGCFEFTKETSGTYDEPIVLLRRAQRGQVDRRQDEMLHQWAADLLQPRGCRLHRRRRLRARSAANTACARSVRGYPASEHSRGIAVLNCDGHDQDRDPFFSGQADWACGRATSPTARRKDDGHGIYLSNGGDWNIVRFNETYGNLSSDFQINADPASTCAERRHPVRRPALRCLCRRGRRRPGRQRLLPRRRQLFPPRPGQRSELHQRAPERGAQQHLRSADPAQCQLLAGDRQPEARLERQ